MVREEVRGVEARYWSREPDGRVMCRLCPRECRLGEGQTGFCAVRQVRDGRLYLTAYGRCTGLAVDPMEKKPLYHYLPGSRVLSFGTVGCNLGCRFCQNWVTSKTRAASLLAESAPPEGVAQTAAATGCQAVAFTYNDPVTWAEYAMDTADACHSRGIRTVAVTAGYISSEARGDFFSRIDAANVDLKSFSSDFYRRLCLAEIAPVLDTLSWLKASTDVWIEVTTLLIPGHNDAPPEIEDLCRWFMDHLGPDVPLHLTAFHPDFRMRYVAATPPATLRRSREIALRAGLRYVYTGNVVDVEGSATYCPGCGAAVIQRRGFSVTGWNLVGGACSSCATAIAGVLARAGLS